MAGSSRTLEKVVAGEEVEETRMMTMVVVVDMGVGVEQVMGDMKRILELLVATIKMILMMTMMIMRRAVMKMRRRRKRRKMRMMWRIFFMWNWRLSQGWNPAGKIK